MNKLNKNYITIKNNKIKKNFDKCKNAQKWKKATTPHD